MPFDANLRLQSYDEWEANRDSIKSGGTHWYRTSRLSAVNSALKKYFKTPSFARRLKVDDAIHKIRTSKADAYRKYERLLIWLYDEMERKNPHRVYINRCNQFGMGVGNRLNEMCHYAVTDLQSFPGNIRPHHKGRVWNRYYKMSAGDRANDGKAGARVRLRFDRHSIRSASGFLEGGRCGCCTTFAARAADILLQSNCTRRIEVVAVPARGRVAHCFLVVGRRGGLVNGRLPMPSEQAWGVDYCIVDPWLAALGLDCIYPRGHKFPSNWLRGTFSGNGEAARGLEQKFDSEQAEDVRPEDFLSGIRLKKAVTNVRSGVTLGRVVES